MSADPVLKDLLAIALQAAAIARDIIMPLYDSGFGVEFKSDGTPVTDADRRAEAAIRDFLARECPSHGVLGEEYGETPGSGPYRWLLDPIDGTKSFVHHVPLFGTLIALERSGDPVVGVIACHALGETASAASGFGAHLNGNPIHVSGVRSVADATVLTTSIQGLQIALGDGLDAFLPLPKLLRTWGDCYGYLQVACGRADAMLDPVMNPWDAAALFPIIREAGGAITTWGGDPVVGESVAASNGALHAELLASLRGPRTGS